MGPVYVAGGLHRQFPYHVLTMSSAMPVSIIGTVLFLFLVGGLKGRIVQQSWWRSGLEMLTIAGLAGLAGFVVGRLAGQWVR